MTAWTVANQLTLLRLGLIPAFVIMVVYGRPGWALITFVVAGITDGLDGLIAERKPAQARTWQAARPRIVDLPAGHLGYPAVAMVVGADVMPLADGAAFRPTRVVSGAEATDVVTRLEVLAR